MKAKWSLRQRITNRRCSPNTKESFDWAGESSRLRLEIARAYIREVREGEGEGNRNAFDYFNEVRWREMKRRNESEGEGCTWRRISFRWNLFHQSEWWPCRVPRHWGYILWWNCSCWSRRDAARPHTTGTLFNSHDPAIYLLIFSFLIMFIRWMTGWVHCAGKRWRLGCDDVSGRLPICDTFHERWRLDGYLSFFLNMEIWPVTFFSVSAQKSSDSLIRKAIELGSYDNVCAVIVDVRKQSAEKEGNMISSKLWELWKMCNSPYLIGDIGCI